MEIEFEGPKFYSQEDENYFFEWIYKLPAFKNITGQGLCLRLELKEPVDIKTTQLLLILFKRWFISPASLLKLKNTSNEYYELWNCDSLQNGNGNNNLIR